MVSASRHIHVQIRAASCYQRNDETLSTPSDRDCVRPAWLHCSIHRFCEDSHARLLDSRCRLGPSCRGGGGHEIESKALAWFAELPDLQSIRVPRCLAAHPDQLLQLLHVFVDASTVAYGAVAYARTTDQDGIVACRLVAAKSRVAPVQTVSVPRLELLAAIVVHQLAQSITQALGTPLGEVVFWSDSNTVLLWLRSYSQRFKPFVANRVSAIQSNTQPAQWRYVPTGANPADVVSRGASVDVLASSTLWWEGPDFLRQSEDHWPATVVEAASPSSLDAEETAAYTCFMNTINVPQLQPERYCS